MNHSYFQLSRRIFQSILYANSTQTLDTYIARRWAGHSKWQNVKADKDQAAKFKSIHFSKINKDISAAVRESGDNPNNNSKLRNLIEAARKLSMPNATIQKAIDRGKSKVCVKPYWVACTGPGKICVVFEVTYAQQVHFVQELGGKLKKIGMRVEKNAHDICIERGVIICEPLKNLENQYDKALEDALDVGADEVFQTEDKTLVFECPPDRVDSIETQLLKKGYSVQSSGTEVEFHEITKLTENELQTLRIALDKIVDAHDDVQRCSHNIVQ